MKTRNIVWLSGVALVAILVLVGARSFATPLASLRYPVSGGDGDTFDNNGKDYAAAVSFAVSAPKIKYRVTESTPQFVILSFDGSKSVEMLQETLAFQQKMQAENKPIHFSYFINAAYFLTKEFAQLYQAPGQPRGVSNIGFAQSSADIALRVKGMNTAFASGDEIGSHSAGHFIGNNWTYDEWKQEFNSFNSLMSNVQKNNPTQPMETPTFLTSIHGFRAPNLGVNDNLYRLLGDSHFTYDASGIGPMDVWPTKDTYGVWHIPLGTISVGAKKNSMVAMDYNLWRYQSNNQELAVKGTTLWKNYFAEVESAYQNYFDVNYNGYRAPVVIGHHFSRWNDGVYWEAMKAFAENACGRPQVRCATYRDLVSYLNTTGVPPIIE